MSQATPTVGSTTHPPGPRQGVAMYSPSWHTSCVLAFRQRASLASQELPTPGSQAKLTRSTGTAAQHSRIHPSIERTSSSLVQRQSRRPEPRQARKRLESRVHGIVGIHLRTMRRRHHPPLDETSTHRCLVPRGFAHGLRGGLGSLHFCQFRVEQRALPLERRELALGLAELLRPGAEHGLVSRKHSVLFGSQLAKVCAESTDDDGGTEEHARQRQETLPAQLAATRHRGHGSLMFELQGRLLDLDFLVHLGSHPLDFCGAEQLEPYLFFTLSPSLGELLTFLVSGTPQLRLTDAALVLLVQRPFLGKPCFCFEALAPCPLFLVFEQLIQREK